MEINRNCELMTLYIQSKFDLMSDEDGIIGVTYNTDLDVYDFFLNTNRFASHRAGDIPDQDELLKKFLTGEAASAARISGFTPGDDLWL